MNPSSPAGAEPRVFLLVPAGGRGLRMGGETPKQFRDWGGVPLLLATLRAFLAPGWPRLRAIALALPPDRLSQVRAWDLGLPLLLTEGGETRQDSVAAALALLPRDLDTPVLIHDAVRPFPHLPSVLGALETLEEASPTGAPWAAALPGEPSTDTLKRVDAQGRVLATEPRAFIHRAQTPQVARLGTWLQAHAWARERGFVGTDDVSLLEAQGLPVKLIPAPPGNVKLTTPEDWARWQPQGVAPESTGSPMTS